LLLRRAAETFAQALLQRWADLVFDDLSNAGIQVIPDGLDGCIEPPVTQLTLKNGWFIRGKYGKIPFKWMMKKDVNALVCWGKFTGNHRFSHEDHGVFL
jgi:hypothetical protein